MQIVDSWLRDMPQQFQDKHNIEVLIKAFSKQMQELDTVFTDLEIKTDLDTAVGQNLDYVGTIIPLTRKEAGELAGMKVTEPVMPDERYRQFLRYKAFINTNNCTYYDIMRSIEILWGTNDIKYYEDPSRPATILINLQTMNIDSEVDPRIGKILAVKPAGVALIYTVRYIVIMDVSQSEKIYLIKIRIHIALPFWNCIMLDGSLVLDSSHLLDSSRGRMLMAIKLALKGGVVEERFENFTVVKRKNLKYLDGSLNLDGATLLNAAIDKEEI